MYVYTAPGSKACSARRQTHSSTLKIAVWTLQHQKSLRLATKLELCSLAQASAGATPSTQLFLACWCKSSYWDGRLVPSCSVDIHEDITMVMGVIDMSTSQSLMYIHSTRVRQGSTTTSILWVGN